MVLNYNALLSTEYAEYTEYALKMRENSNEKYEQQTWKWLMVFIKTQRTNNNGLILYTQNVFPDII